MKKKTQLGLQVSEKEYRDIPFPSYSLLSDISKNGTSVIGGARNTEIGEMDSVIFGKIVDSLLTDKKDPDNLYVVTKSPTGKAKAIIKALASYSHLMPNKHDIFHEDNKEILDGICEKLNYYKNYETRLKGLKNYVDYFNTYKRIVLNKIKDENKPKPEDCVIVSKYIYSSSTF